MIYTLTSKLYTKNGESTDIKKSQGAAETREDRTKSVRPLPERIFILVVILAPVVISPVSIPLPLAYPESKKNIIMNMDMNSTSMFMFDKTGNSRVLIKKIIISFIERYVTTYYYSLSISDTIILAINCRKIVSYPS